MVALPPDWLKGAGLVAGDTVELRYDARRVVITRPLDLEGGR
jgi:hypothetical protein